MKRRFEGKTLDEAISTAAAEFGVETYQLSYHIAVQKRGFLGGTKRVVIEAEPAKHVDETARREKTPAQETTTAPREATKAPQAARAEPDREPERSKRKGRGRQRDRGSRGAEGQSRNDRKREPEVKVEPAPEQHERSDAQQTVADWCERALELALLDLEVRTEENDEEIVVRLYGPDARVVVAKGGEVLDSLQVLVNKAFVGRKVEKRIEFDVGTFKKEREEELGEKARRLAEEVKKSGVEKLLPAMSPIERRIVHIALRDIEGIETVSRGNGFLKRVAVVPTHDA